MSKLSKAEIQNHAQAEALVALARDLTLEERDFVLAHWDPSARHINSAAGAFFTPSELVTDFTYVLGDVGEAVIDLCAGIGALSFQLAVFGAPPPTRLVCVEKNPDYVRVGRKVLPEATWIEADVFDVSEWSQGLSRFDTVIGNPPFGKKTPGRKGTLEHNVVLVGMGLAEVGQFILPQTSAGFVYSSKGNGREGFRRDTFGKAFDFQRQHGLHFGCASIDTGLTRSLWKGTAPATEVVTVTRIAP